MQKRLRTGYKVRRAYRRARLLLAVLGTIGGASAMAWSAGTVALLDDPSFVARGVATVALCAIVPWLLTEVLWRWHRRQRFENWQ
jgi:hypothetical protein